MYPVSKRNQSNESGNVSVRVRKENKPYQIDFDQLNPHPGFATTIFISWEAIADYFDLIERWPIHLDDAELPEEFKVVAFEESKVWAQLYFETYGKPPTEEEIIEKENQLIKSLQDHWSPSNILLSKFNFEKLISDINEWSHLGAKEPHLFGNPPDPGKSLEYFLTDLGINFTVYEPFMIPYTEIYYELYSNLPEWNYDDIDAFDIIETLFAVQDRLGRDTKLNLDDWASKWEFSDDPKTSVELETEHYF